MTQIKNVLWTGPRLLVPLTVEALVVTQKQNTNLYSLTVPAYNNYNTFGKMAPVPFVQSDDPDAGIHLHWAIPDGLTKGIQKEDGEIFYPLMPNRWIIIRHSADSSVERKAFVVASDFTGDGTGTGSGKKGNSPFLFHNGDQGETKFIGRWYDLENWKETGQSSELFLTATGISDPSFAAYTANVKFVFSFHDDFSSDSAAEISYLVAGWYSNQEADPIYNKSQQTGEGWSTLDEWKSVMETFTWSVGKESDLTAASKAALNWLKAHVGAINPGELTNQVPAQLLPHGIAFGVQWPGNNQMPATAVPSVDPGKNHTVPYVSIANSGIDALAAFMQWQLNFNQKGNTQGSRDAEVGDLLEAFFYRLLPKAGATLDLPELENVIHSGAFTSVEGGLRWKIQAIESAGGLDPAKTDKAPPKPGAKLQARLATLNSAQRKYDQENQKLKSLQGRAYGDWMRWQIAENSPFPPIPASDLEHYFKNAKGAVTSQQGTVTVAYNQLNHAISELQNELTGTELELVNEPAPRFHAPNDPILMISGVHRSYKRGSDVIFDKDNSTTLTRFTGQFVNNLTVKSGAENTVVKGSDVHPEFDPGETVPKEIVDLLNEAVLLDTGYAEAIAKKAMANLSQSGDPSSGLIEKIKTQQTLVWNSDLSASLDKRTLEKVSGFNVGDDSFRVPSKIGVWKWEAPWAPLHLEWGINFYPCADVGSGKFTYWKFDGRDYKFTGANVPPPFVDPIAYQGKTVLTPQQSVTLQKRLKEFINQYQGHVPAGYIPLQDVVNSIGSWDVLSQTLTGLTQRFVQWDLGEFGMSPNDEELEAIFGFHGHGRPIPLEADEFYPVRAGFIEITKLWVVDDHGQVYNVILNSGSHNDWMSVIPGEGTSPQGKGVQLQLSQYTQYPPRIPQPSRLNFNWLASDDDSIICLPNEGSTPVCGWVMPNHLDLSLMVYDAGGVLLGELLLTGDTGNQHASWFTTPGSTTTPETIENAHLKGFVKGLLAQTDSGQALANLMASIDETQWAVDPLGERENQSLSILVGRPIAVLRASLGLELDGLPYVNQAWKKAGQDDIGGITSVEFPVQIGDIELPQDGVMGFFLGDDYSQFNSVHKNLVTHPANPPYVVNQFVPLKPQDTAKTMTVLLDPRGQAHINSGILPVQENSLPDIYTEGVLEKMELQFITGPVLLSNGVPELPVPAGDGTKWSWLQPGLDPSGQTEWSEPKPLVPANPIAKLPTATPDIVEGRMLLSEVLGDALSLFFFSVNGKKAPYSVPSGSKVDLSWASQGGRTATLSWGAPVQTAMVELNDQAYSFTVAQSETIKLTIANEKGDKVEESIEITAT